MNDIAAMMRYERAGDQHVGRIASGLPTEQPDFAILPPMFHTTDQESRERVNAIVKLVFPYVSTSQTRAVVEVGLASVIYHEQFLREVMPRNHPLFRTTLFLHSGFVQTLRQHVTIESHGRTATGIPPHVCLLKQMKVLPGEVTQAVTTIIRQEFQAERVFRSQSGPASSPCLQCSLSEEMGAAIVQSNKELVQKNKELLEAIPALLQMAGNGTMESRGSRSGVQTTTTGAESRGSPSAVSQYARVSSGNLNDGQVGDRTTQKGRGLARQPLVKQAKLKNLLQSRYHNMTGKE